MEHSLTLLTALLLSPLAAFAKVKVAPQINGLAPEVPGLNLKGKHC